MKRIIKDDVPEFWASYIRKNPRSTYKSLSKTKEGALLRTQIRQHMLIHQQYLCAYCCKTIDMGDSHNEHICPQDSFPERSMHYENLLVSCSTNGADPTCGVRKGNDYDIRRFVHPILEECERHFRFRDDGVIEGTTLAGKYTIDLLNLNAYHLKSARAALFRELKESFHYCGKDYVKEKYILPDDGHLHSFVDMTTYFYNLGYFDSDMDT